MPPISPGLWKGLGEYGGDSHLQFPAKAALNWGSGEGMLLPLGSCSPELGRQGGMGDCTGRKKSEDIWSKWYQSFNAWCTWTDPLKHCDNLHCQSLGYPADIGEAGGYQPLQLYLWKWHNTISDLNIRRFCIHKCSLMHINRWVFLRWKKLTHMSWSLGFSLKALANGLWSIFSCVTCCNTNSISMNHLKPITYVLTCTPISSNHHLLSWFCCFLHQLNTLHYAWQSVYILVTKFVACRLTNHTNIASYGLANQFL